MEAITGVGLQYKITGRYMNGSSVTAYHIVGTDGRSMKASKELVAYFAGKGMITNARIQTNTDDGSISLRGVGISLNDIPVLNERTGEIRQRHGGEVIGKVGVGKIDNSKFEIAARLFVGPTLVGYVLRDNEGRERKLDRSTVIKFAKDNRILNAKVTQSNGTDVLRGTTVAIDELPRINISRDRDGAVKITPKATDDIVDNAVVVKSAPADQEIYIEFAEVKANMINNNLSCIRDKRSNAQGGFKYPIIDLVLEDGTYMTIETEQGIYRVSNVTKGIADNGVDGIQFIVTDYLGRRIMVICSDINYMVLHLHSLGFVAYTAIVSLGDKTKIKEMVFESKEKSLMWREYFKDAVEESSTTTVNDTEDIINIIEVESDSLVQLQRDYDIEMSPISDLGRMRRYPTVSMLKNGTAIMGIKTVRNYYEVDSINYGYNAGIGLKIVVKSTVGNTKVAVTDSKITKDKVNLRVAISMCAAALAKTEVIQEIMVENESEGSAVGYNFKLINK